MTTHISLLRGINVSGHRVIKMDALKKMCSDLSFSDVQTYLQSGNIIFRSEQKNSEEISKFIKFSIEKVFGYDVPVITLTLAELELTINTNPFLKNKSKDPSFFYVTFLSHSPTKHNVELLTRIDAKNDRYEIIDKAVYLYCPGSYGNSKLTNSFLENKLKVTATTRNWKTINEIFKLATNLKP